VRVKVLLPRMPSAEGWTKHVRLRLTVKRDAYIFGWRLKKEVLVGRVADMLAREACGTIV